MNLSRDTNGRSAPGRQYRPGVRVQPGQGGSAWRRTTAQEPPARCQV